MDKRPTYMGILGMLILAGIVLCFSGCPGDGTPPSSLPTVESIVDIESDAGGRVDWSLQDLIVYDKVGEDGYHDLWIMNPDGSNKYSLTDGVNGLPGRNMGNPRWHPSGQWIVFIGEKGSILDPPCPLCTPGAGLNNDLWAIEVYGSEFYQLTNIDRGRATLHPHFSHDGKKLVWAESRAVGDWVIKLADFKVGEGNVSLENIVIYRPGNPSEKVWYETHGFSPDDSKLIFTANLEPGQHWTGADIYTFDLETGELNRLTKTLVDWDEHAQYSPDYSFIVWMSSTGYYFNPSDLPTLRTDFWIMWADGSSMERLTYFNEPGHIEYTGEKTICGDLSWSPDGKRLVAKVQVGLTRDHVRIVILTLK